METQPHNQDEPAAVDSPRIKQAIGKIWELFRDDTYGKWWVAIANRYIASDGRTHDMCGSDCWYETREAAEAAVATYEAQRKKKGDRDE